MKIELQCLGKISEYFSFYFSISNTSSMKAKYLEIVTVFLSDKNAESWKSGLMRSIVMKFATNTSTKNLKLQLDLRRMHCII